VLSLAEAEQEFVFENVPAEPVSGRSSGGPHTVVLRLAEADVS
jgi:hypothetical protein